jgi:hypothetical protein
MDPPKPTRACSNCRLSKPLHQFQPKKGSKLTLQCLSCRERPTTSQKRTATTANLTPERPRYMQPTVASQSRQSPTFYYHGIHSSDDSQHAEARAQRTTIQRAHRAMRRAGEEPSPTPSLSQLMRRPIQPSPNETSSQDPIQLSQLVRRPIQPSQSVSNKSSSPDPIQLFQSYRQQHPQSLTSRHVPPLDLATPDRLLVISRFKFLVFYSYSHKLRIFSAHPRLGVRGAP